jgi:hypothetical protein
VRASASSGRRSRPRRRRRRSQEAGSCWSGRRSRPQRGWRRRSASCCWLSGRLALRPLAGWCAGALAGACVQWLAGWWLAERGRILSEARAHALQLWHAARSADKGQFSVKICWTAAIPVCWLTAAPGFQTLFRSTMHAAAASGDHEDSTTQHTAAQPDLTAIIRPQYHEQYGSRNYCRLCTAVATRATVWQRWNDRMMHPLLPCHWLPKQQQPAKARLRSQASEGQPPATCLPPAPSTAVL